MIHLVEQPYMHADVDTDIILSPLQCTYVTNYTPMTTICECPFKGPFEIIHK